MDVLGSLILLIGFIAFLVGAAMSVYPIAAIGFSRRLDGALVIGLGISLFFLGRQMSPELRHTGESVAASAVSSDAVNMTPVEKPVTKAQALLNMRIDGFSWEKSGFGNVMIATFVIYNDNRFPVKDVVVTCKHAADSGTIIDNNTRTIYERVDARSYYSVVKMNMGFIHSAANSSTCHVVNFSHLTIG